MSGHPVVSRTQWLQARLQLLEAEKDLTRRSDALAAQRQALPWVKVEADYRFETEHGPVVLADLFQGCSQLLVYHFMFGPDYAAGCPSCSMIADGFNGVWPHLAQHDVMLWAISRAPLVQLLRYRERMGWSFPWASSRDGAFNVDYGVGFPMADGAGEDFECNDRPTKARVAPGQAPGDGEGIEAAFARSCGTTVAEYRRERPGLSTFVLDQGQVYHCYSTYARGVEAIWASYAWLDRAPRGRNEVQGPWWRRRDEYPA